MLIVVIVCLGGDAKSAKAEKWSNVLSVIFFPLVRVALARETSEILITPLQPDHTFEIYKKAYLSIELITTNKHVLYNFYFALG